MVSMNIRATMHRAASPATPIVQTKLRTIVRAAMPVVVMSLILVGLVAFRFWATFPAIRDVAAG
jgi:hypothetical protein